MEKCVQFDSEAVAQALAHTERAEVGALLAAVRSADLDTLVSDVTPDIISVIRQILEQAEVYVINSTVLTDLAQNYPSIGESDIPSVVRDFERRLREAFRNAAASGKRTIRINLK